MAITNLNNTHLTAAQVTAATAAITALETELAVVSVNLSAADRQRYGSINEQNKLLVNKTMDYHNTQPGLQTPHVDWLEYTKDFNSRSTMEGMIARLESLIVRLNNAKVLYDYDNYQAALADYAYANFMAGTGSPGYETKLNDMKQFFTRATASTTE
jgi:alkyl sulfatase BDS1-like metallo-beta-lactamase superfamily hydrolase